MQNRDPQPVMPTIDLAAVFFTEWDHLLTRIDKLNDIDDARVAANRPRSHTSEIRTLQTVAASLERIGTAIKKAHYGEE